jgi:hypothetical protein
MSLMIKPRLFSTALVYLLLFTLTASGQSLESLRQALQTTNKAIQAVHFYPADVGGGQCHWVPVTAMTVKDHTLTITETWRTMLGQAQTVLTGTLHNSIASGTWQSDYSSGSWSYNFNIKAGKWNKEKTSTSYGVFTDWQPLKFIIVYKTDLKDGAYDCL